MKLRLGTEYEVEIDDEDFSLVSGYKWVPLVGKGPVYAVTYWTKEGKTVSTMMHRFIVGLNDPEKITDHIDGNGLNNRRSNLRVCTRQQNAMNSAVRSDNKSGAKGVYWDASKNLWRGIVRAGQLARHKNFNNFEEARDWCAAMRLELHGQFAVDHRASYRH